MFIGKTFWINIEDSHNQLLDIFNLNETMAIGNQPVTKGQRSYLIANSFFSEIRGSIKVEFHMKHKLNMMILSMSHDQPCYVETVRNLCLRNELANHL